MSTRLAASHLAAVLVTLAACASPNGGRVAPAAVRTGDDLLADELLRCSAMTAVPPSARGEEYEKLDRLSRVFFASASALVPGPQLEQRTLEAVTWRNAWWAAREGRADVDAEARAFLLRCGELLARSRGTPDVGARSAPLAANGVPSSAVAAETTPVRRIMVHVHPYYDAGADPAARPEVHVGRDFDALLASDRREDVVSARDQVLGKPELITPMAMMVLAIRLYDVGLRDDAVFWFYAAKARHRTLAGVLDVSSPLLAGAEVAVRDFAALAGGAINGYAFCDVARQQELRARAVAWVEENTYEVIHHPALPALAGDRATNLEAALAQERASAEKERAHLAAPGTLDELREQRRKSGADARYCWH